ncbi:MAG: hypothetical protein ACPGYL_04615, partial [Rhodospirillaceae bacterium]
MMRLVGVMILAGAAQLALLASPAMASDEDVVRAFYTELLSAPLADDLDARVETILVEDWVSVPTPRGGPGAAGMVETLRFFGSIIP